MENKFKQGDVVRLKSGGTIKMVVNKYRTVPDILSLYQNRRPGPDKETDIVECYFEDGGKQTVGSFAEALLELV